MNVSSSLFASGVDRIEFEHVQLSVEKVNTMVYESVLTCSSLHRLNMNVESSLYSWTTVGNINVQLVNSVKYEGTTLRTTCLQEYSSLQSRSAG
jgi:hypothetical protein